ncbi:acylphosphatase [Aciditerrimonas ferrireducens]|uniref:acylphosphatase n=1 Tax=Aciditerrimonas ferrireducens TaxID=667306 RepID=A0ABV6C4C4_9ACTN
MTGRPLEPDGTPGSPATGPTAGWCHLRVLGRVQGVGYRLSCQQVARQLGLVGWVRNLADGSVEVLAIGPDAALADLVAWCRQGPPLAEVERVDVRQGPAGTAPPAELAPFPDPFSAR